MEGGLWRWLGLFGFLHGLADWCVLLGEAPVVLTIRAVLLAGSFFALAEFGRRSWSPGHPAFSAGWFGGPALFLAGSLWWGPSGVEGVVRTLVGVPAGVLAEASLWRLATAEGQLRRSLRIAAAAMVAYAVLIPWSTVADVTPAGWMFSGQAFPELPMEVLRTLCALV